MRIAWIGPMPNDEGGASGVSNQLLRELNKYGVSVDCYMPGHESALPSELRGLQNVRFICGSSTWQWNRWYSRNRLLAFITGQVSNLRCENRLALALIEEHRRKPYDVIYQFSHIEFSVLRKYKRELPVIILHPSVHAMGELRWHRAEASLSKLCEPAIMRMGARCLLYVRSIVQRRHIRFADKVLALSENFARDLITDYRIPNERIAVVPNPIDLARFVPNLQIKQDSSRLVLLFVSRIAVRKGVEMIVELSHRLNDLAGQIEIRIIGDKSMWSDYTALLQQLDPKVARYVGSVSGKGSAMTEVYQSAHILIQPSRYEPFGLTVGEALACGTPVVASDKVGSAEGLDPEVCRVFPDGNLDALEKQLRTLIGDLRDVTRAASIYRKCRLECERAYDCSSVTSQLLANLNHNFTGNRETLPSSVSVSHR